MVQQPEEKGSSLPCSPAPQQVSTCTSPRVISKSGVVRDGDGDVLLPTAAAGQVVTGGSALRSQQAPLLLSPGVPVGSFCSCSLGAAAWKPLIQVPYRSRARGLPPPPNLPLFSCCSPPRAMPVPGSGGCCPGSFLPVPHQFCKASDHRLGSAAEVFQAKNS